MVSEMLQPIRKAAALTRALAVASSKMNTTMVLGDTLASRPSSAMVITRPMGSPGIRSGAALSPSSHEGSSGSDHGIDDRASVPERERRIQENEHRRVSPA